MKTKYFIQKLEDFGFVANVDREVIIIKNKNGNGLAALSKNNKYSLDTLFNPAFENLRDNEQKGLFDLLVEYTRTPIEEREEEKKWGDESNKMNEKIAKLEDLIDELEEMSWNRKEYKVIVIRRKIAEIFEEIKGTK